MKNILLIITSFYLTVSCSTQSESSKIGSTINALSEIENCKIQFKDIRSGKGSELNLYFDCKDKDEFFAGKTLLYLFDFMENAKYKRDFFSTKINAKGKVFENTLTNNQISDISRKRDVFRRHFKLLTSNRKGKLDSCIDISIKNVVLKSNWYSQMFKNVLKNEKKWHFNGFCLNSYSSDLYVVFANIIYGEVLIYMTYKVENKKSYLNYDSKIQGIGLIPLK